MTPSRIACIGSRETPPNVRTWMEEFGAQLVRQGHTLVSGNAPGADQAWAKGGNSIDPGRVDLCLPWSTFERASIHPDNRVRVYHDGLDSYETCIAAELHPRWAQANGPTKMLLARDVMIVKDVRLVIGYVNPYKPHGGGTGFAFRVARRFDVPCVNVERAAERHRLECAMRDAKLEELMKAPVELEMA